MGKQEGGDRYFVLRYSDGGFECSMTLTSFLTATYAGLCQLNVSLFKNYNSYHTAYKWEETVSLEWKRDNYKECFV
jgi:hypothetical protein